MAAGEHTLLYKRARFVTRLPVDRLYSPSHFWIAEHEAGIWRVGFTRFATRMLGEMVEHEFQVEIGAPVASGQIIGWIEGFKAISDIYCIAEGKFAGGNPALDGKDRATEQRTLRRGMALRDRRQARLSLHEGAWLCRPSRRHHRQNARETGVF